MLNIIQNLSKLSPYPIFWEDTINEYSAAYFKWGDRKHNKPLVYKDFRPSIHLNKQLSEYDKKAFLIHELAHARHYKHKCKCYRMGNKYLRELHASRFALKYMLRYKMRQELKNEIEFMEAQIAKYGTFALKYMLRYKMRTARTYARVYKQLQREKIWKKVKIYLDS